MRPQSIPFPVVVLALAFSLIEHRAPAQDKSESPNRRSVTTTEWPSLRGVLSVDDVRSLLELDEDEDAKIRQFVRDDRRGRREPEENADEPPLAPDAPAWERGLRQQERRLKAILGEMRYVRIRQLQAQAGGLAGAFTRDEPSHRLGITIEQRNQARKEIRATAEEMADRFHAVARGDYNANARVRSEFYEKLTPALTALLTDGQKEKWAEMTGEPADDAVILKVRALGGR